MAEKETKSGSNLPWANIVALLVAAGGFLTLIPAIQTSRPPDPGGKSTPVFGDQTIPSRLWQDPFEEVMRDREGKEGKDGKEERLHQPGEIVNAIARDNDPQKEVGVLIVMMMSGPHAEARERRLRTRVAVVEGMSRSGYAPRDSEHLGYLHLPWPRGSSHLLDEWIAHDLFNAISLSIGHAGFFWWTPQKLVLTEVAADNHEDIPFEWFDLTPGHKLIDPVSRQNLKKVLVLYVQQDACRDGPFTRLAYLSKLLKLGSEPPGGDRNVPTTLLGPVTSDGLDAMVREARTMGNETRRGRDDFIRQQLHGIKIFSPTATAADDRLLGLDEDIAARNILIASANVGLEVSLLGPCRPGFPIIAGASYTWLTANSRVAGLVQWKFHHELTFQRTNLTDNDIVWEMIQELMRRGINPTRFIQDPMNPWGLAEPDPKRKINWKNPVAIITEMDSFRGRELPNTFRELCNPKRRTDDKDRWIYFYHYLRGLDGRLPGDEKDKKPGDPSNKEERKRSPNARPDGHDQTDSLLRLADTMATEDRERRNNGEMGFRAIGVLGSDVYDKLLILRALRPRFPDAVFFTNNLDAQLSQSEEWEAAHNLVVVSGFGVRLDKRWQRNIPPFRDGYQTATFLGTLVATGKFEEEMGKLVHKSQFDDLPTQPSRILDDIRDFPRVFEIGRNGALDLSVNSVGGMKTKKDGTWALKNAQVAEEYTERC